MTSSLPLIFVSAAALVDAEGRVLLAQRPEGKKMAGLWEFPGGKVHEGETPEAALVRELKEELGIDALAKELEPACFASHAYQDFHLFMPLYVCRKWEGEVRAMEHTALEWVSLDRMKSYAMPEADMPLVDLLQKIL